MLYDFVVNLDNQLYDILYQNLNVIAHWNKNFHNKVTLSLCEFTYFLYNYTCYLYFISFKFFISFINDDMFQNPILNYILTNWLNITYTNIYTCRLMNFNTFYQSMILDKCTKIDSKTNDLVLFYLLPQVYILSLNTEIGFSLGDNFVSKYLNYFCSGMSVFVNLKSLQYLFSFIENLTFMFIIFLFIFFFIHFIIDVATNILTSDKNIDSENLSSTALTECEKEIASVNDILPLFISVILFFGLYFFMNSFFNLPLYFNSYCYTFIVLPLFFSFVFIIPLFLLFDFGLYLFIYLRGSSNTSLLSAELLYDLINLFAYYIRVVIQSARLVLMLTAIGSYQELVLLDNSNIQTLMYSDTNIYIANINLSKYSIFNLFFKITVYIMYILYEIFHTYFVLTIQTIAFFAMIFWLFFYLFSFFVSEQLENYFQKRRLLLDTYFNN